MLMNSAPAPALEELLHVGNGEVDTSFQRFGYINKTVFLQSDALPVSLDFLDDDSEEQSIADGLELSFMDAGYDDWSSEPWHRFFRVAHGNRERKGEEAGVTVEWSAVDLSDLLITVDGIDAETLRDWMLAQLAEDATCFGASLIEWVIAHLFDNGFDVNNNQEFAHEGGLSFLPTPEELEVDRNRHLLIYTWGKALRKCKPSDSQSNFNAGILNGRGGGVDLHKMNGTWEEVQRNVSSCSRFPGFLESICTKIETSTPAPLHTVSINCTKGRHRSVAAAEILKKYYYPNAVLKHLTIS